MILNDFPRFGLPRKGAPPKSDKMDSIGFWSEFNLLGKGLRKVENGGRSLML